MRRIVPDQTESLAEDAAFGGNAAISEQLLDIINRSAGKQIGKDLHLVEDDENLFDLGMTSIGFISMIVELENAFELVFEEDELQLRYYRSISAIRSKLLSKLDQV